MAEETFDFSLERVKRITREASRRVDELVFAFGHLPPESPERRVLEIKVRDILHQWADQVWECGALPQELWTVIFHTATGPKKWQYPCSHFVEVQPSL